MILPNTTYKTKKSIKVTGNIHFNAAYSETFEYNLPENEIFDISIWTEPNDEIVQVWPANPGKYESQLIPEEILKSPFYDSYSFSISRELIDINCEIISDFAQAIYFYSVNEEYGEFSNFFENGILYQEKYYPTVEHFYQAQKFDDAEYSEKIRNADSPKIASELGKTRAIKLKENWDDIKVEIMTFAIRNKFENNERLKDLLLSTGKRLLIENSPYDNYWGIGKTGEGYNQLGNILMRIRAII
ncbi:NADAR family protein [Cloacibacterium normanense]